MTAIFQERLSWSINDLSAAGFELMEYWEFLLQGEGDQNWLPLDASQVEILEGRYRVMAHTSQTHTAVDIRISQLLLDHTPPKRRSLKRQGQTGKDGLLVVMPFTHLTAGTWSIHCSGQTEATTEDAAVWQYAVQLQVLPYQSGDDDDWFADDGTAQISPGDVAISEAEHFPGGVAHVNLEQVAAAMNQSPVQLAASSANASADPPGLYRLSLSQTALVAKQGQTLSVSAQVAGGGDSESTANEALVVRLVDPQNASAVLLVAYALPTAHLPATVSLPINLPEALSTRLLLGEVALVATQGEDVTMLALQRFTITVDLAALFDAIADQAETDADGDLDVVFPTEGAGSANPEEATETDPAPGWETVDFLTSPPRSVPSVTLPRGGFNLPPKIYYPTPHEVEAHTPVLPPLGKPKPIQEPDISPEASPDTLLDEPSDPSTEPTTDTAPAPPADTPTPAPPVADSTAAPTTAATSPPQGLTLPPIPRAQAPEDSGDMTDEVSASAQSSTSGQPQKSPVPLLPSHEDMGFRDLKLQERFWSRLNDLAVTIQQTTQSPDAPEQPGDITDPTDSKIEFIPFAGEVVIYEDETLGLAQMTDAAEALTATLAGEADEEIVSPPAPMIELQEGELVAGDTVLLTLRVPFHPNRLYLKVWIIDPQTRALADEPRQIMNLAPDGKGHLEGSVQLTVPHGCLEAWFEAIAVDMITQQESYKTSVNRTIVPAGVTAEPLDEFDF
jgi:hypothetical protein